MPADYGNSLISKPNAMLSFIVFCFFFPLKRDGEQTTIDQAVLCESNSTSPCVVKKKGVFVSNGGYNSNCVKYRTSINCWMDFYMGKNGAKYSF